MTRSLAGKLVFRRDRWWAVFTSSCWRALVCVTNGGCGPNRPRVVDRWTGRGPGALATRCENAAGACPAGLVSLRAKTGPSLPRGSPGEPNRMAPISNTTRPQAAPAWLGIVKFLLLAVLFGLIFLLGQVM